MKLIFTVLPFVTVLVALIFAVMVFKQYLERRRWHQFWWSIALFLFAFAAFAEGYAELFRWSILLYKLYYVAAATLVAFLGLGSIYLLFKEKTGHICAGIALLGVIVFLTITLKADIDPKALMQLSVGGKVMPKYIRIFSPLLTVPGSFALFGGAIYSAVKLKNPKYRYRVVANYYIAAGTFVIAVSGAIAKAGFSIILSPSELIGIILLFTGFLKASTLAEKH